MKKDLQLWWETRGYITELCTSLMSVLGGQYRDSNSANRVSLCGAKARDGLLSLSRLMESIPGVQPGLFGNDALKSVGNGIRKAKRCFVIRDKEKAIRAIGMNLSSILNPGAIESGVRAIVEAQPSDLTMRDVYRHTIKLRRCAADTLAAWWMLKRVVRNESAVDTGSEF